VFKKLITSAIMTSVVALTIPFATTTVEASTHCTCRSRNHRYVSRRTVRRYRTTNYASGYTDSYGNRYATTSTVVKRPGYYSRHRRLVNTGIGAGVGALVGGLLGGRRGVGLGLLAGGAGSQVFTHYQRPRNYTRVRY